MKTIKKESNENIYNIPRKNIKEMVLILNREKYNNKSIASMLNISKGTVENMLKEVEITTCDDGKTLINPIYICGNYKKNN